MKPIARFIFWERRGKLAAQTRSQFSSEEVVVKSVADERELHAEILTALFSVVVLDRPAIGDRLADVIAAASALGAFAVVVGPASSDESRRDRDLGARLLLFENPDRRVWAATVRRLLVYSQDRPPRVPTVKT